MKKFILFLFLVCLNFQLSFAQDINEDEFADPSLQNKISLEEKTEKKSEEIVIEENKVVINEDDSFAPPQIDAFNQNQNENLNQGSVILENPTDLSQNYKQRRKRHGVLFSVTYEKYYPTDYFSQYRDVYIEDIIDSDRIDLLGVELGYKLNFQLGSIAILGNYAKGGIVGKVLTEKRYIDLIRYGFSANYALDNYLNEPWVVPYGQVGLHRFQVFEDDLSKTSDISSITQISFNYKIGVLFQLNWIEKAIDPSTQIDGLRSSGLENTFIDVFATSHFASTETYDPENANSEGDPDLGSDLEFGVALKMEF